VALDPSVKNSKTVIVSGRLTERPVNPTVQIDHPLTVCLCRRFAPDD